MRLKLDRFCSAFEWYEWKVLLSHEGPGKTTYCGCLNSAKVSRCWHEVDLFIARFCTLYWASLLEAESSCFFGHFRRLWRVALVLTKLKDSAENLLGYCYWAQRDPTYQIWTKSERSTCPPMFGFLRHALLRAYSISSAMRRKNVHVW